ncbi:MAG: hypothetical protein D6737_11655 [Chloroflexi bacterium]|nr:MAG: hypothetical protein D6737_11655 [Chloroflexota bacterium]
MQITSDFDTGNIIVENLDGTTAQLAIRPDTNNTFYQWFYFRASGDAGESRRFTITNAGGASYPFAWPEYDVLASYDETHWFRLPTRYEDGQLIFEHQATQATASYAFFVPYTAAQRESLLKTCEAAGITRRTLGHSYQQRPIEAVVFGDESRPVKKVWVIARQHAGEPMAEYAADGLIRVLLATEDTSAQSLLQKATVYVVPNINPDGSTLGNLRANAAGVDLNRAWDNPTEECPEISAVLNAIEETGVDFFIDLHGDEHRPYIWIVPPGVEISPEARRLVDYFEIELAKRNPEVQPPPVSVAGVAADHLGMAVNYIAATYGCPAWTPELPFKATSNPQDGDDSLLATGCMRFGRSCVEALDTIIEVE